MTISALESYLGILLARARCGQKLGPLALCAYRDMEQINRIESDKSLSAATRKRLIRQYETSIGECLRLAAKHDKAREVADAVQSHWPRQSNQEKVFSAYRAVLRRKDRPPTFKEWMQEDLNGRKTAVSVDHRRKRDHVLREMQ